jgi:hypothetical protein
MHEAAKRARRKTDGTCDGRLDETSVHYEARLTL